MSKKLHKVNIFGRQGQKNLRLFQKTFQGDEKILYSIFQASCFPRSCSEKVRFTDN